MPRTGSWHTEESECFPGQKFLLKQHEVLYEKDSEYQNIKVFTHEKFGTVLSLDGCVQATEYDEFLYQEMLTFLPLCSHPCPKNVLIIGGGDGGVAREVLKDKRVDSITLVDIDESVIDVSKKFMTTMSSSFDHSKVEVIIKDAVDFVNSTEKIFDVVIIDLTDEGVDTPVDDDILGCEFYRNLKKIISEGGILAQQTYSPYSNNEKLAEEVGSFKKAAHMISYGFVPVPSFPNGNIGILFGRVCKDSNIEYQALQKPLFPIDKKSAAFMGLRCYHQDYHISSCVLPLEFSTWFYGL